MATTPEAEQLAGVLRQLKDRSGLSYGALAGKLHVSTSTLHRYCNGDAVPAEFAPVERLARLCGAGREEMVDLHRRWILADEARRRGRAGAETAPAETATAGTATAETAPAGTATAGTATAGTSETSSAADAGAAPETVSGTVGTADATASPAPTAATAATASPAPTASPAAPEELGPPPVTAPGTGEGPRRKRLVVALAAAAVVVLAVPVAVVASDTGDSRDPDARTGGPAGAVAPTGETRSPSASRTGSASPSASASPGTGADPSASRPGAAPSAAASRAGETSAGTGGVPLRVGISSYNWAAPCGQYYLLDKKPGTVPPQPAPQDHRTWARVLGGVDAGRMQLQLTATGRTEDSVVITDVHVRTVSREKPLEWDAYSMGEGCGSGVTPQTFDVDLDAGRPVATPVAGTDGDLIVPAKDFPYKVASNDPQVLNFDVHTEEHHVGWYLEVAWSSGDRRGTVRVDDDGRPFRTSAVEGRPMHDYWPDKGEWVAR